jgi:hypothetical protein
MKKLLLLGVSSLALTTSCVSNLSDDYNTNPKSPTSSLASGLISNAERTLVRTVNSSSVNLNPLRFYVQYWVATDYPNESQYDLNTRAIPANYWNALYRDCIRDLREAKTTIPSDITVPTASKDNALAITEILEIYAWANLVETFGNIPYSEAFDVNITQPKYDDQATIYADLISRLNAATSKLDVSQPTGFGVNELIYTPSSTAQANLVAATAGWVKFANAMKLRMAIVIADADPAKAKTLAEATVGKLPSSNADAVDLTFNGTFPNTNPLYEDLVRSARTDFAGSNIFINALKGTGGSTTGTPVTGAVDPRLNDYFNTATSNSVPAGTYAGGVEGTTNSKTTLSLPGAKLRVQTLPGVLISYAQVELMQAEAIERGFAMGGTAASHYNAGVTASILEWGGTTSEATTYLAQPTVTYTGGSAYKQQIGYQLWVALYNQPSESWTQWRRLDYPQLPVATNAIYSVIPRRFLYPTVEQNLNNANYSAAATAIGGDDVATKLFWDKF